MASGRVYSLVALGDEGLAVGAGAYTVDLLNMSALHAHWPTAPYHKLIASGTVHPLTVLEDKGLAT